MKSICVPTSVDAMARLDTESCVEGDLVEISLEQSDFDALQQSGLIRELNASLGLMIDEFEDESITDANLDIAIRIYDKHASKLNLSEDKVNEIQAAFALAQTKKTAVFFYL